ncbi:MAG: helix-turn-helix domain-containing protein [Oscillospiraceae bacterium]|nr:helix-turn-helix domain containing protein [Oscillospiraceae bacterium]MDY2847768.1 helix-turn-helix domain-containing protein [Oscillospiraceae bacterium]
MPPKPKFTREEIIEAALKIASDKGMKALTSRELGAALGSSARPIFTVFKSMDEVNAEVRKAAMKRFEGYTRKAEGFTPIFKQVGLQMILFAVEQPKLYRLLFMSENSDVKSFEDIFATLGDTADMCIDVIRKDYGLTRDEAMLLFKHTWIFTYGVGTLISSGGCRFCETEIQDMLSQDFVAMLALIKSGKAEGCTTVPQKE